MTTEATRLGRLPTSNGGLRRGSPAPPTTKGRPCSGTQYRFPSQVSHRNLRRRHAECRHRAPSPAALALPPAARRVIPWRRSRRSRRRAQSARRPSSRRRPTVAARRGPVSRGREGGTFAPAGRPGSRPRRHPPACRRRLHGFLTGFTRTDSLRRGPGSAGPGASGPGRGPRPRTRASKWRNGFRLDAARAAE